MCECIEVRGVEEADWQALSHTYTLFWDGSQMLLLFVPSSCHLEFSVLHSHRRFVFVRLTLRFLGSGQLKSCVNVKD